MGRPPSNGGPSFRFNAAEVAEMEAILQEHKNQMPTREALTEIAEKFSSTAERSGKFVVQMKQVWNWFQNRRYAIRAKGIRVPGLLNAAPMPRQDSTVVRNIPQPHPTVVPPSTAPTVLKSVQDNSQMEFEAKSARDGAWYDVAMFISHRSVETGDPDVLIRFSGFGVEEDEWVNVRKHVRQRSLPCESSECVSVIPGDLILCFQEGKEQALYYDAHVLDSQRRRHDVRGCRCRFLVRYDHDLSEEIVPLRKICRRPETDYRLQQLNARNDLAPGQQLKSSTSNAGNNEKLSVPAEDIHKQTAQAMEQAVTTMPSLSSHGSNHLTVVESITVSPAAGNMGISIVTSSSATAMASDNQVTIPPPANATTMTSDIKVTATSVASDVQVTIPPPGNANVNVMESENDVTVVPSLENANVDVMKSENEETVVPPLENATVDVMETDNEVTVVPPLENTNVDAMETDNEVTVVPPMENATVHVMESENEATVVPPLENANVDVMESDIEVILVPTLDNANAAAVVSDDNEVAVVPPPDNANATAVASDDNEVTLIPTQDNAANATDVVSDDNEVAAVPPPDNAVNAIAVASDDNEVTVLAPDNATNASAVASDDNEVIVLAPENANMDVMENNNEVTGTPPDNNVTIMESDYEVTLLALDNAKVALMESDNDVTVTPQDNGNAAASDSEVTPSDYGNAVASDNELTVPSPLANAAVETIGCPENAPTPTNVEVLNTTSVVTSDSSVIVQFTKNADIPSGTPLISQTAVNEFASVVEPNVAADAPALPSIANAVPDSSTTQTTPSLDVENLTTGNVNGVTTAGAQEEKKMSPEISSVDLVLENVDVVMEDT